MSQSRITEQEGVTGTSVVESYDKTMRGLMQKGYLNTSEILKTGIKQGIALEVGPGPGYLGIEWLTKTENTTLKGLDISADMIKVANRNASEFGVQNRAEYILGNAKQIPFANETFDAVFTNGSLHEWADPVIVFNEVHRVLKKGGLYCITDLRRNINLFAKLFLQFAIPKERKEGFLSSLHASYTENEMADIIKHTKLTGAEISKGLWTIIITGKKS